MSVCVDAGVRKPQTSALADMRAQGPQTAFNVYNPTTKGFVTGIYEIPVYETATPTSK